LPAAMSTHSWRIVVRATVEAETNRLAGRSGDLFPSRMLKKKLC
jgi:hypothetical protein